MKKHGVLLLLSAVALVLGCHDPAQAWSERPAPKQFPIQSLLSARMLVSPQLAGGKIFFLSDMSGVLSLYSMDQNGSLPQPLLPAGLALTKPQLMEGLNYQVLPGLGKILVMIDEVGNENYQPYFIPIDGGIPELLFGERFKGEQLACGYCDPEKNIAYFRRDDRKNPEQETLRVNLATLEITSLGKSLHGNAVAGVSPDHKTLVLLDGYSAGDYVLYIWREGMTERKLLFGVPIEKRTPGQEVRLLGSGTINFTSDGQGLLFRTNWQSDSGNIGYLSLDRPDTIDEVPVIGLKHKGSGELVDLTEVEGNLFLLEYNIDGCSWVYECRYEETKGERRLNAGRVLCGLPPLDQGVLMGLEHSREPKAKASGISYVLSLSKAASPSQIYLWPAGSQEQAPHQLSHERILGIDQKYLAPGEDASFTSFDGLRVSARLYLPSKELGYEGPRPLVVYIHGGPQSQERPDFTWFSMPLIQYLTLNGFAVFVPNVRGSSGYGLKYMKQVDRDWGGKDVLDHVEGLKMLEKDPRIDSSRRAVMGRSYGGFMTLTLVSRHPGLWKAGCDMFGPYELIAFINRLPESWRQSFYLIMGHPEKDKDFLMERSPKTYVKNIKCPLLIVQGKNDPRVLLVESQEVYETLKANGIPAEILIFDDEGHDVSKFGNKVVCYTRIVEFFKKHLQ
jgi:dipeptidyl aminopeptidase/acylaminoacyl peptidase